MRFFEEIAVAPSMLVSELVLWLALGRPPLAWWNHDGDSDIRQDPNSFFEVFGRYGVGWDGFTREEFYSIDTDFDFDEYYSVLNFDDMPHDVVDYLRLSITDTIDYAEGIGRNPMDLHYEKEATRKKFIENCDCQFDWHLDRAKVTVLSKFFSGSLEAKGVFEAFYDEGPIYSDFKIIEPQFWSSNGFSLNDSELTFGSNIFKAVQVETRKAFEVFPEPYSQHEDLSLRRVGSYLRASHEAGVGRPSARRGRPKLQTAEVDQVIQNEFRRRLEAGVMPEKREAILQEAMDWARDILTKEISRSTAQRILKPLFDARPK